MVQLTEQAAELSSVGAAAIRLLGLLRWLQAHPEMSTGGSAAANRNNTPWEPDPNWDILILA